MTADSLEVLRLALKQLSARIEDVKLALREARVDSSVERLAECMESSTCTVLLGGRGMSVEPQQLAPQIAESLGYRSDMNGDVLEFISSHGGSDEYVRQLTDVENTQLPKREHFAVGLMAKRRFLSCYVTTNYTNEIEKVCALMDIPFTKSVSNNAVFRVLHVNGDMRAIICENCGRVEYIPTILSPRVEYEIECHCGWKGLYKVAVFPQEERTVKSVYDAAVRQLRSADLVIVCGWSGRYDPDILKILKGVKDRVFCVNPDRSAPVCGVSKEVFVGDAGSFFASLAKALGFKERDVNVKPKKLLLAYPNWVIKEFLEKLPEDLAKL